MSIHIPNDIRDELKARALRWFNQERVVRLGLEPLDELPRAEPMSPFRCLICASLGGDEEGISTATNANYARRGKKLRPIPEYVFATACAFDEGAFKDLVLPDAALDGEWDPTAQAKAQQIIDRLAVEIRAGRDTGKSAQPVDVVIAGFSS